MWKRWRGGQSFPIHFYYKTGAKHASLPHCGPALWGAWLLASSQHVVSVNSNGIPYMRFRDNHWNNMKCNVNVLGVTSPPLLTAWGPKPEQSLHLCLNKPPPPAAASGQCLRGTIVHVWGVIKWGIKPPHLCDVQRGGECAFSSPVGLWVSGLVVECVLIIYIIIISYGQS